MKRRFADKGDWKRVLEREFKIIYVDNEELKGYLTSIYVKKVSEPLIIKTLGEDYCIANDGHTWIQYLPYDKNYVLTVMFDEKGEIIQWYFDISEKYELSEEGMPYYDDLYLDVVVLTTGKVVLLDEDEIEEAFQNEKISKQQYEVAWNQTKNLTIWLENNFSKLEELTKKYFKYMKEL